MLHHPALRTRKGRNKKLAHKPMVCAQLLWKKLGARHGRNWAPYRSLVPKHPPAALWPHWEAPLPGITHTENGFQGLGLEQRRWGLASQDRHRGAPGPQGGPQMQIPASVG